MTSPPTHARHSMFDPYAQKMASHPVDLWALEEFTISKGQRSAILLDWRKNSKKGFACLQGISFQTVISNLALRERRTDISDILWHLFSRKLKPILISKLTFPTNKWEVMKNYILCKYVINWQKWIYFFSIFCFELISLKKGFMREKN